jgi:hypothetical protein
MDVFEGRITFKKILVFEKAEVGAMWLKTLAKQTYSLVCLKVGLR